MKPLPPPGTFAEGQRLVYGLLASAAGMFCGLCAVAMVALLMWGRWSAAEEHSIVIIFGWSLGGFNHRHARRDHRPARRRPGRPIQAERRQGRGDAGGGRPMILRFLNLQGLAGLAATALFAILLIAAKIDVRHWRKQSGQFEQLYHGEQAAIARTVAGYRAAADAARAADRAAADRVAAEQRHVNERTAHDYEARLAAARDRARGVQYASGAAPADPCGRGGAPVPGLPIAPCRPHEAAGENRLPPADALLATEQAIQLDELINWVRAQGSVDPNAGRKP